MAKEKVKRRLAAIFAADMVGYSRLMEADEEGTIARQNAHRKELIDPTLAEHNGRIVKLMGDAFWSSSQASSMRCDVPSRYSRRWLSGRLTCQTTAVSATASVSTWATL